MKKYRKKPIVLEAERWPGFDTLNTIPIKITCHKESPGHQTKCEHCDKPMNIHGSINSFNVTYVICPGDWIFKGVNGDFYPVKPSVFKAMYEEVK